MLRELHFFDENCNRRCDCNALRNFRHCLGRRVWGISTASVVLRPSREDILEVWKTNVCSLMNTFAFHFLSEFSNAPLALLPVTELHHQERTGSLLRQTNFQNDGSKLRSKWSGCRQNGKPQRMDCQSLRNDRGAGLVFGLA